MGAHREEIRAQLQESCRVKQSFPEDLLTRIEEFAVKAAAALGESRKLVFFGNGGSAADAQHMAAELVVRLRADRPGLAALALTTNPSVLTAASNDYGFEHVFARQIESLVSPGDVLVALSTSGNSPNIVRAFEAAKKLKLLTCGMLGRDGGKCKPLCDIAIVVPHNASCRIQEVHKFLYHTICEWVDSKVD